MKILWVKAGGLVPPDTGGKIRSYNILCELAHRHSVTFFSFYGQLPQDEHASLKSIFKQVVCIPLKLPAPKSFAEMMEYSLNLASSEPYGIVKFCRAEVRRSLLALLKNADFDVIICDFVIAAGVIPWDSPLPKILFTHNVEAMIWRRHYEVSSNPLWKAISWLEWRKMASAEARYLRRADYVLTVSDGDRDSFLPIVPSEKISVIPTGVDVEYFRPMRVDEAPDSLVFTGSMDWLPNEDAILYFAEEILPLILRRKPKVWLEVVGRKPSRKLQSLAESNKSIRLTGWVDDIRPFLARGTVCIVPLRIGGGTRLKIFEAMAMGKAVVSTSIGAEGLPVRSGDNISLADTPHDFADAVTLLLEDRDRRKRLGDAARALVEQNYSWSKVAENFAEIIEGVATQR